MKGKTIIALVMAILMVASIVSATAFANIGTLIYNRIAPQDKAHTGIQTITNTGQNNPSSCTTQSDCPNGNCACKCAAKPAAGGSDVLAPLTGKVTIPISNLKLSPSTASSGTLIAAPAPRTAGQTCSANLPCATGLTCTSGKCVAQTAARTAGQSCSTNLPCATGLSCTGGVCAGQAAANTGGAAGTDTTTVGECQSACLARCRAACTPSVAGSAGTVSCASNADCTVGYCRIIPSSVAPSTTGTCVPCTTNSNCGTGKTCNTATGQCAASAAGVSGLLSSGTKLALTGKAITLSNLNIGDKTALPAKLANGVTCTSNTQCTNGLCSAGKCAAPTAAKTAGQTCTTTQQCATGLNCDKRKKSLRKANCTKNCRAVMLNNPTLRNRINMHGQCLRCSSCNSKNCRTVMLGNSAMCYRAYIYKQHMYRACCRNRYSRQMPGSMH